MAAMSPLWASTSESSSATFTQEKFFTTRRAFKHQNNRSCSTTTDNWLRQVATGESGKVFEVTDQGMQAVHEVTITLDVLITLQTRIVPVPITGIATGLTDNTLLAWGGNRAFAIDKNPPALFIFRVNMRSRCYCATVSNDGNCWRTRCPGGLVRVWSAHDGELLGEYHEGPSEIGAANSTRCLDFSHDGKYVASGKTDRLIKFWAIAGQNDDGPAMIWHGHSETVSFVHLTSDGSKVYSASWDGTIRLWDLITPNRSRRLEVRIASSSTVHSAPTGRYWRRQRMMGW